MSQDNIFKFLPELYVHNDVKFVDDYISVDFFRRNDNGLITRINSLEVFLIGKEERITYKVIDLEGMKIMEIYNTPRLESLQN